MSVVFVILPLLAGGAWVPAGGGDKTSVATCFVRKVAGDEEVGPKLVIGWRYRNADRGKVSYSNQDIHDPANLLDGRVFVSILENAKMRTFIVPAAPSRKLPPILLGFMSDDGGKTFNGGIQAPVNGRVLSTYFGGCMVKDYGSSADAIFAKLKTYGAQVPQ